MCLIECTIITIQRHPLPIVQHSNLMAIRHQVRMCTTMLGWKSFSTATQTSFFWSKWNCLSDLAIVHDLNCLPVCNASNSGTAFKSNGNSSPGKNVNNYGMRIIFDSDLNFVLLNKMNCFTVLTTVHAVTVIATSHSSKSTARKALSCAAVTSGCWLRMKILYLCKWLAFFRLVLLGAGNCQLHCAMLITMISSIHLTQ